MGYDFNVTAGSVQAGLDALRIVEKHSVGLIVHDASHVWAQRIDGWRNLLAGWARSGTAKSLGLTPQISLLQTRVVLPTNRRTKRGQVTH